MRDRRYDARRLVVPPQRRSSLAASAAAALIESRPAASSTSSRCLVTQVFDAGDRLGLMRRLEFDDETHRSMVVVASLTQLNFDRKFALYRDIAAFRKSRRERACLSGESVDAVERRWDDGELEPLGMTLVALSSYGRTSSEKMDAEPTAGAVFRAGEDTRETPRRSWGGPGCVRWTSAIMRARATPASSSSSRGFGRSHGRRSYALMERTG